MATAELEGKTVLLTGATDGLGRALATDLAGRGATLLLHGRDEERGAATLTEVADESGSDRLSWYRADLASLAEVRELAEAVGRDHDRLDVLVSNAGIGTDVPGGGARQESADGIELRFAVNYLAGFVLTERLLPLLQRSAPARIVMVASLGQAALDFGDPMLAGSLYEGRRAYAQSKLAQITYAIDLTDRLGVDSGVTVNSLHPATFMPTKIVLDERGTSVDTLDRGVEATLRLAVDPELDRVSGRFFDRERESRAESQAYDPEARRKLRSLSEELAG